MEKAQEVMKDAEFAHQRTFLGKFNKEITNDTGLACYGWREVAVALKAAAVKVRRVYTIVLLVP